MRNDTKQSIFQNHQKLVHCVFWLISIAVFILIVSFIKYRTGMINYYNSDATFHTLLTMTCYDETPASIHHFVPIVTLGQDKDKFIPWGACIPDQYGNYYYTSFSPACFALSYFFIKIFNLPINENSLYIFNSILLFFSTLLFACLLNSLYKNKKERPFIVASGILLYVLVPEILHGMGIIYWSQSIMQVTLLAQILCYYHRKTKFGRVMFYILCFINPYIEWTGYVANGGFVIAELVALFKDSKKRSFYKNISTYSPLIIILLTCLSFGVFTLHYLSVVDKDTFFDALFARFSARTGTNLYTLIQVIKGYLRSFLAVWVLLPLLLIFALVLYRGFGWVKSSKLWSNKSLLFVSAFPVLENFVMLDHANLYSYDRMKMIIVLVLIICDLVYVISLKLSKPIFKFIPLVGVLITSITNIALYTNDSHYAWEVNYRETNQLIASYIDTHYDNRTVGYIYFVRGYLTLTFNEGVYEWQDMELLKEHAIEKGSRYAVLLLSSPDDLEYAMIRWSMVCITGATIYDFETESLTSISVNEGSIVLS